MPCPATPGIPRHQRRRRRPGRVVVAQPAHLERGSRRGLIQLDQPPLVQLEQGEEPHDDLQPLAQTTGQPRKGHPPDARQLVEQLIDRVPHADAHRRHVVEQDSGRRLRCEQALHGGLQVDGGDAGEEVRDDGGEALVRT